MSTDMGRDGIDGGEDLQRTPAGPGFDFPTLHHNKEYGHH